jgi:hypothetical protein
MSAVPVEWIEAANAAGLVLDMVDVDPHDALLDAARQHQIPEDQIEEFVTWAQESAE